MESAMWVDAFLPEAGWLRCQQVFVTPNLITIHAQSVYTTSRCPACHRRSSRIHSRHARTLADLPLHGTPVRLHLRVRRFFCDNPICVHRNFAERLPGVIARYGRRTIGLATALERIAFACGGEGGARLASKLGMPASADTLLRLIRRADRVEVVTPRVLGVDDWALRRGQRYGTIFCDLEPHRPIDLLPERSCEVLSTWLGDHPR